VSEIKVMNDDEIRDFCIKKDLKIFELEQQLQQKENIIKEVREYIENHIAMFKNKDVLVDMNVDELLEILDKEEPYNSDEEETYNTDE